MTAKDLKNALLQEAVQGKLVPQIESEGNAKELLEEIRKEKAKLIKEGKIKKEKPLPEITEDEIPFDIPENWCWCRLGEVFETTSGTTPQSKNPVYYTNGTIGWVRTTDLNNAILSFAEIKITEKAKSDYNLKMIPKNSVCIALYGGAGTIGKNAILNFETTINQSVCAMLPNSFADMRYLQYFLQWQRPYWMDYASGSRKDPNINQIIVKNCPFPLPPLCEQKRIVAAIEKFMPLIEEYGKKETELKAFNEQIGTLTKKAILQEAVHGKLVPQISAEGNAKDLLEEIKKEKAKLIKEGKIKKEKPLPDITEEEIPFDIPESWCWCRFSEIFQIINGDRGKNYPAKSTLSKQGIPFISALNLKNNTVEKDEQLLCVSESQYNKLGSGKLEKGDMVVCIRGSLGKHGIFPFEKGAIASSLVIVRQFNNSEFLYKFLNIYLDSSLFYQEIKNYDNGTAQPNLAAESFKQFLFPLPPLAEQKRIIVAIEKMLPLCEKIGE